MNQQRSRRFRSAQEAKEKDEDQAEFMKLLKSQNGGAIEPKALAAAQKKTWDSNAITPGTPFMDILATSLRYWCAYKLNTDPGWASMKVLISDATVPGEGEHKIMQFIRSQRSSPLHDPNTRHVIYGLDADLIMLGLATHEPHFRVLREDVFFQESKARTCRICGQKGHVAEACKGQAAPKEGEFDEKDKALADKPFIWLHVSILREYLEVELYVPQQPFRFDLERALDDWVFMCFFVGNDFLPHLPSLDIRENGIDTLIAIWRDNIPYMGSYLTKDGKVDLERAQFILDGLAKQEDAIFRRRKHNDDRREANAKRRKLEDERRKSSRDSMGNNGFVPPIRRGSPDYGAKKGEGASSRRKGPNLGDAPSGLPLYKPGARGLSKEERELNHELLVNRYANSNADQANKSAAVAIKDKLNQERSMKPTSLGAHENGDVESGDLKDVNGSESATNQDETSPASKKRKADEISDADAGTPGRHTPDPPKPKQSESDEPPPDTIRLWEEGYADRYYEQKFKVEASNIAFRQQVARDYVEGLAWVLLYYLQGCPSWTWYYPHHYAPFAADFVDIEKMKIGFEQGIPFRPFEQLMGVLPAASSHAIPEVFRSLMQDPDSEIIDFYPTDFPIDLNGKKFAWQGVALLPFIDEKRLLDAMATKYPLLSAEEAARNDVGKDVLIVSDEHPLYDDISNHFYSKRQGAPKYNIDASLTQGLTGTLEKNPDFMPQGSLTFPLKEVATNMESLPGDRSMRFENSSSLQRQSLTISSVYFDMPKSIHIHKSMLLRGVYMPQPILEQADKDATSANAKNSGRSFGGVPFRGERNGNHRGGHMNYANDRPNPFAAYVNPNMVPPPPHFRGGPPPPGVQHQQGYPPHLSGPRNPPPQMSGYQQSANPSMPNHPPPHSAYNGGYRNQQQPPTHSAQSYSNTPYEQSSRGQYHPR